MSDTSADILIVDDRPENLEALEVVLANQVREIVRATSGQEALEILLRRGFAVILLDVRMPGMDGFETAAYVRKSKRSMLTPIIFVTAGEDRLDQIALGYSVGAVDYIVKPFQPEILRSKVQVFIDLHLKSHELRKTAQELAQANDEIREAYRKLEVFSYTVAHDLRAPLRAMAGYSRMLREDSGKSLDPAGQEYAARIEDGAKRMDSMIQSLLGYCRAVKSAVHIQTVDPLPIIRETLKLEASEKLKAADVTVSESFPQVLADPGFLIQAISNLVSNAIKFRAPEERAQVQIRHETRNGRVRIWVEDKGIGIDPLHHARIFNTFERLRPREFEGAGTGLAVVRAVMERMGGTVGVESATGKGSRFWIELAPGEVANTSSA
jgi:two-component system, sensor histidine kinase and response regulator